MSDNPMPKLDPVETDQPQTRTAGHGVFIPLLLITLASLGWTVFQTTELIRERNNLNQSHEDQVTPLAQSQKVRVAADSLAAKMQTLADQGDANAQLVINELHQRGITINTKASTPTPP